MKSIFTRNIERSKYVIASYMVRSSTSLYDAAWNLAIGQSIGNPNVRNSLETDSMIEDHACKVILDDNSSLDTLKYRSSGQINIAFPVANIDLQTDGISQLLCFLMGGHLDINIFKVCQLVDLQFHNDSFVFNTNNGIQKIRSRTGVTNKPLLGGILKPKTGVQAAQLLDVIKQLVDGGVNFIKEDEILSNPPVCTFDQRLEVIQPYIESQNVVYCYCINADPHITLNRCRNLNNTISPHSMKKGVHVNIHSGLGIYNSIRKIYPNFFLHFQKSGDKLYTNMNHNFAISWDVVCKLAGMIGVDSIHAGMWGGYSTDSQQDIDDIFSVLHSYNVIPALSCGMHPGLVNATTERFGNDYIANVGGAIHGHPGGTLAGTMAMRQAIDGTYAKEYYQAIEKWGIVE